MIYAQYLQENLTSLASFYAFSTNYFHGTKVQCVVSECQVSVNFLPFFQAHCVSKFSAYHRDGDCAFPHKFPKYCSSHTCRIGPFLPPHGICTEKRHNLH